ncbi:MAG TPA: phosphatase PAP2 family protein [Candidatus Paceibacterota bacterium]|nr:phosphatase PAP2 family protein [Candidatus Paceibacterota bacterium]
MNGFDQTGFRILFDWSAGWPLRLPFTLFLAEYLPYLLGLGFLMLIFEERGRRRLLWFLEAALVLILARGIVVEAIAYLHPRPRPFQLLGFAPIVSEPAMNSMPSGHAAFFFALAMVVFFMSRRWGVAYFVFAAAVALGRIFAGVHWPTDVLAGAAIGVLSALFVHLLLAPSWKIFNRISSEGESSIPPPTPGQESLGI